MRIIIRDPELTPLALILAKMKQPNSIHTVCNASLHEIRERGEKIEGKR